MTVVQLTQKPGMIRRFVVVALLLAMQITAVHGQDFGIKFSGFIKNDCFYDTRQTVSVREGHFLLYPAAKNPDANGADLNERGSFNFLAIQTRLSGAVAAPSVFGAKTAGLVEADFFGNENASFVDANGFRLRHAYAKLSWSNTELLVGQFWHPFFVPACFSEVISFNTGAPMQPFSRNPQLRLTRRIGACNLILAATAQRDFTSGGGAEPLRNSEIPELNGQLQFTRTTVEGKGELLAGVGSSYKALLPQLNTTKSGSKYKADETVSGVAVMGFLKHESPAFTLKVQGVYGQNLYDLTMLGGYAVSSILDSNTNSVKYTTIDCYSLWSELILHRSPRFQFGLWAGYTKNLGSDDSVIVFSNRVGGTDVTVRGAATDNSSDIKSIYRISPRIAVISGALTFALETEFTSVAFAQKDDGALYRDAFGKVTRTEDVGGWRLLFATILKF